MDRTQHLKLADAAVTKAEQLADTAEHLAKSTSRTHDAGAYAAVGSLWNDIALTHTAIAGALLLTPED
ncbi:hypothetical protein ACWEPI_08410 [Streptomyces sp. NPDC004262]